jgi:hypothetical protein
LPCSQLSAIVAARDVGIIYGKACVQQVSLDGFRAPIARLASDDQHLTKWLLLAGLYSGSPEIGCILLRNPYQPLTHGHPLQHESYESFVRVTDEIPLPTGHPLCTSQISTFSCLEKFISSGKIA